MTTIPLYAHVAVVAALLALNILTVRWALHTIRGLQAALLAKRVLLGQGVMFEKTQWLGANDTLTLEDSSGNKLLIDTTNATTLTVRAFPS